MYKNCGSRIECWNTTYWQFSVVIDIFDVISMCLLNEPRHSLSMLNAVVYLALFTKSKLILYKWRIFDLNSALTIFFCTSKTHLKVNFLCGRQKTRALLIWNDCRCLYLYKCFESVTFFLKVKGKWMMGEISHDYMAKTNCDRRIFNSLCCRDTVAPNPTYRSVLVYRTPLYRR